MIKTSKCSKRSVVSSVGHFQCPIKIIGFGGLYVQLFKWSNTDHNPFIISTNFLNQIPLNITINKIDSIKILINYKRLLITR